MPPALMPAPRRVVAWERRCFPPPLECGERRTSPSRFACEELARGALLVGLGGRLDTGCAPYYIEAMPMPIELQGLNKDRVTFVWSEESNDVWPARVLRLRCTCALCKSEDTGERLIVDSEIPEDIIVTGMHLVGNYGVGIQFSDGHNTGIYRFSDLEARASE